jgi:hypothetical protein
MNDCKYCGADNPVTVFNCLKCNAVMPVQPAPAQNIPLVQERKPRPVQAHVEAPPPARMVQSGNQLYPVKELSFKDLGIYMASAFLMIALVAGILYGLAAIKPEPPVVKKLPTVTESVSGETGAYLDYQFTLMKKESENKAVALFQPRMLPRNDAIFIGAARQVISQAFGKEATGTPVIVGNEIKIPSKSGAFYVFPIKEDTGEIHTLIIRH